MSAYSWIPGEEIVADVMTKQGSTREALDEIIGKNRFSHMKSKENIVTYEQDEFKIRNLVTKKEKQAQKNTEE